ncbi:unannotated protein [freshwater metagenome]|uniref:Unannotated protein n=1 Tax=freshwater metagenome TaxID=449393 RepID=A0A6J5ZG73_9ZZZZ
MISSDDQAVIEAQLGRPIRGAIEVAHRCPCGNPTVVKTQPRLEDGTPFPTMFYLTCPRATGAVGTLEANYVMKQLQDELAHDEELAAQYRNAHEEYLVERYAIDDVEEIHGISAGGMPDRVKCLHVLAAHALAKGPGVNPLGDKVLELIGQFWEPRACMSVESCE